VCYCSFLNRGHNFAAVYFSSWVRINMGYMRLVVYYVVCYTEKNPVVKGLGLLTTLFALVFFGRTSLVVFYISYELTMFPLIILIYLFGGQPEKVRSIYYALLYTGVFSMPFMVEVVRLEGWYVDVYLSPFQQALVIGLFLRKRPVYFLHVWLPKTHVEAPTSARILLAGVLLKVGLYGLMKMLVFFNRISIFVVFMSLCGVVVMPVVTALSVERKVMTACRRVTHMNFIIYGVNIMSNMSMRGSYLLRVAHGFVSSLMFCFIGMLYTSGGTRILYYLGGISGWSLLFRLRVGVMYLSNAGTPPLLSFWGELLILVGGLNRRVLLVVLLARNLLYSFYYSMYLLLHFFKMGGVVRVDLRIMMGVFARVYMVTNRLLFCL